MKTVENAIKFRRSMQEFDTNKKIDTKDLTTILNAGRLAPSGLGSEPTRVLVIRDNEIKKEITEDAFNQLNWNKIKTADTLILFVSLKEDTFKSREFVSTRLQRWGLNEADLADRTDAYVDYLSTIDAATYSSNQAYIAMSYMSLQAASLDIESVIMQGFAFDKLNDLLDKKGYINKEKEAVHISMAVGYSNEQIRAKLYPQIRISLDEFCDYI
ncbi:nitroreductase family protein [Spiroplasma platyhelix]|uniref:Nitroreductase domain-containing protein n=1 Tax=Spiroplasma platyhelix PALS-1 TaxID=1276218 RepID=A0A846U4J3_9MOLU|nr:nitroreductase family protein [Spiroplasma platyhelix]MBE4704005.1 putative NAD(P)H nitroreductase [Spiroplasma platyhelix PALS-1]NKE38377.1 hypothetical protein [Spiroplasma platyhelix PALS-1]UJB29263.1 oxygen-insensitive NAD(P)H nitroreductase [Spiroplasma platyhelix PALS-1]